MVASLLFEMMRLDRQQWANLKKADSVQFGKLQKQLERANRFSKFYSERFKAVGFQPEDLKSVNDLRKLPLTTKVDLQSAGNDVFCSDVDLDSALWLKTSGSGGSPLSLPFTKRDKDLRVLKELRAYRANGYRMSDCAVLIVEPRSMVKEKIPLQRLNLLRREYVSIMDPEVEQLERIKALKPAVIYGYTSSLRILAEKAIAQGLQIPKPKMLISSAELLDPPTRRLLTQGFGVEPNDFYGSMEFGWIAWQCQHRKGYHINSDCLIVECLKDGVPARPGEEGELVITNLHSDAAPLIRYVSGDTGVMAPEMCACGRNLPVLLSVNGRLADCIILPDGRKVSPYTVTCAIEEVSGVSRFKVVQERVDEIAVQLLGGSKGLCRDEVRRAIQAELGQQVKISVDHVESLPTEPNGKFKVVKSLVKA